MRMLERMAVQKTEMTLTYRMRCEGGTCRTGREREGGSAGQGTWRQRVAGGRGHEAWGKRQGTRS